MEDTAAELVDAAGILAGELPLTREDVDLSHLVRERAERVRTRTERAPVQINVSAPASLEGHWDPRAIGKVVDELLSNALRFGGGTPIDVTLEREGEMAVLTPLARTAA